ncbi:MAG: hypothetical protein KBE09_03180 [Candidatus Pacebacteria bacterium]|nr:hypothetical protein [Candidatus Paceibacterota bacterium]
MRLLRFCLVLFVLCFAHAAHAQEFFCPTGAKLVTSADLAQLQACGATNITVGMCLDTATQNLLSLNECSEAKTFLKSLPKETPSQCGTESNASIDGLNAQFSICAANFIKSFMASNGPVRINSAYRSQAQQQCVCGVATGMCGGQGTYNPATGQVEGGSSHLRGLALDITPLNGDFVKLHAFAASFPTFGVSFPLGMADKQHLEPTLANGPCAKPSVATPTAGVTPGGVTPPTIQSNIPRPVTFSPFIGAAGSIAGTYLLQLLSAPSYTSPYTQGSLNNTASPYGYFGVGSIGTTTSYATSTYTTLAPQVRLAVPTTTEEVQVSASELLGSTGQTEAPSSALTLIQPVIALVDMVSALPTSTAQDIIVGLYTQVVALLTQVVAVLVSGR